MSQPETEYGVEAYWDCLRSGYHLVLYLAPHTLKRMFAIAKCDQVITDSKRIYISFIRAQDCSLIYNKYCNRKNLIVHKQKWVGAELVDTYLI